MAYANRKLITGKCTLSFPNLFKAVAYENNDPKYSCNLIFDPDDETHKKIQKAAKAIIKETWPKSPPKKIIPLERDGDEYDYEGYEGRLFISPKATQDRPPGIVDKKLEKVIDPGELYPGCIVRADISVYVNPTFARVCAGLNNLQKVSDGERLGGAISKPEDVFDACTDDDEDPFD